MRSICTRVSFATTGAALVALVLAVPAFGKSADDPAGSIKDHLPDFTIRLVTAPSWDSRQSWHGESRGTFAMEGGVGILATVGTGEKESWHGEAELGFRKTSTADMHMLVGTIDTWTVMANGYFGFKVADKFDGYAGAGIGVALHHEDRGRDLALGYQVMVGVNYELGKKMSGSVGLRYFGTQAASLGRARVEYRRPEIEVGVGYEF